MISKKRGQGLSLNVIVITILVILVLVVLAVFFTGGFANLGGLISKLYGSQLVSVSQAKLQCDSWCNQYDSTESQLWKNKWCNLDEKSTFDLDTDGDKKVDREGETCSGPVINAQCSSIGSCVS